MVEAGLFGELGGQLVERLFSGILWFGIGIIIVAALLGTIWYFFVYKRKFDIEVKIKSNRSEDKYSVIYDKAAILKNRKDNTRYFRVWGLKREFPVPKYNIMQSTNKGDLIEMFRASEDEFYFLTPPVINKTFIIKKDGRRYPIAMQSQVKYDPELASWMVKRKEKNNRMFDTESMLMKLLPYIPQILAGVVIIFILYILLDHLPTILSRLTTLAEAMNNMYRAEVTISG